MLFNASQKLLIIDQSDKNSSTDKKILQDEILMLKTMQWLVCYCQKNAENGLFLSKIIINKQTGENSNQHMQIVHFLVHYMHNCFWLNFIFLCNPNCFTVLNKIDNF